MTKRKITLNRVDLNSRKSSLEKFLSSQALDSSQEASLSFISDAFYSINDTLERIEKIFNKSTGPIDNLEFSLGEENNKDFEKISSKINEISAKINKISTTVNGAGEVVNDFVEYFKNIFITIQALVEIVKYTLPDQFNKQFIAIIEDNLEAIQADDQLKIKGFLESMIVGGIETELGQKGKFRELLGDQIREMSNSKNAELQFQFKQIVDSLVGKGTKNNLEMARRNTQLGLSRMSESDIEETLGPTLFKLIEKKLYFSNQLEAISEKIIWAGQQGREDESQLFPDCIPACIYFYIYKESGSRVTATPLSPTLPKHLHNSEADLVDQFQRIAESIGKKRESLTACRDYKKILSFPVEIGGRQENIFCFVQCYSDISLYVFLDKEPSRFFRKKISEIITSDSRIIDNFILNYSRLSIVDLVVFSNDGLKLPSLDDESFIVYSSEGDKFLSFEEEDELLLLLSHIQQSHRVRKK